jgi:hypothetical protein
MKTFDIQSLIFTIDDLIFSHTGKHLDDLQQAILEGVLNHQKYSEIAQTHHLSSKYVKDTAGKLWKTLSEVLGEEVSKSNIKSTLGRYYSSNVFHSSRIKDVIQINSGNFCTEKLDNESSSSNLKQQTKLEIATELHQEGLSIEQIAKVLKLPLELVKAEVEESNIN